MSSVEEFDVRLAEAEAITECGVAVLKLCRRIVRLADETPGAPLIDAEVLMRRIMSDVSEIITEEVGAQLARIEEVRDGSRG
jgi:hypothetical protein